MPEFSSVPTGNFNRFVKHLEARGFKRIRSPDFVLVPVVPKKIKIKKIPVLLS
jgi:hypothetical protein